MMFLWRLSRHSSWYYMFKVNNKSTRTRCEICSKSTIKTQNLDVKALKKRNFREKKEKEKGLTDKKSK